MATTANGRVSPDYVSHMDKSLFLLYGTKKRPLNFFFLESIIAIYASSKIFKILANFVT